MPQGGLAPEGHPAATAGAESGVSEGGVLVLRVPSPLPIRVRHGLRCFGPCVGLCVGPGGSVAGVRVFRWFGRGGDVTTGGTFGSTFVRPDTVKLLSAVIVGLQESGPSSGDVILNKSFVQVPTGRIGGVIGRGGDVIKSIREATATRITIAKAGQDERDPLYRLVRFGGGRGGLESWASSQS
jgi:hypothetical protein